jgi:hypothetical protein
MDDDMADNLGIEVDDKAERDGVADEEHHEDESLSIIVTREVVNHAARQISL